VGAIQDVVETAVGETNLTLTIEGRQRFPVRVRYAPEYRTSAQALGGVLVRAEWHARSRLAQLAEIRSVSGPSMISGENGLLVGDGAAERPRTGCRQFRRRGRAGDRRAVSLPAGSYVEWSGQYENEVRARQRLQIVIPIVLLVIYLLLYSRTARSRRGPGAARGCRLRWPAGLPALCSATILVAVWVGFIALFGTRFRRPW